MKLLAVTRDLRFSPNMRDKDRAIMEEVKNELQAHEHEVEFIEEHDFANEYRHGQLFKCDAIFTMMRSTEALEALYQYQINGIPAINPVQGIRNAERNIITHLMIDNNIPAPYTLFNFSTEQLHNVTFPCWIKRAGGWAQTKYDVAFANNIEEAELIINTLKDKYPDQHIMAVEHLEGDLIKFYGVEGTDFFYTYYPNPDNSKFGLEKINGKPNMFSFNKLQLQNTCNLLAKISKIYVYGGDCIISKDGTLHIIDFNDWPSFSTCRQQAAKAIATKILNLSIP